MGGRLSGSAVASAARASRCAAAAGRSLPVAFGALPRPRRRAGCARRCADAPARRRAPGGAVTATLGDQRVGHRRSAPRARARRRRRRDGRPAPPESRRIAYSVDAQRELALERLDRRVQRVAHRHVHAAGPVGVRARALAAAERLVVGEVARCRASGCSSCPGRARGRRRASTRSATREEVSTLPRRPPRRGARVEQRALRRDAPRSGDTRRRWAECPGRSARARRSSRPTAVTASGQLRLPVDAGAALPLKSSSSRSPATVAVSRSSRSPSIASSRSLACSTPSSSAARHARVRRSA